MLAHRRDRPYVYVRRLVEGCTAVNVCRLGIMGRKVDLDDLIDVGEVAELLGLAHKNSVTTYLRRYGDFPKPAIEFADGKCRAWVREDVQVWVSERGSRIVKRSTVGKRVK